MLKAGSLGQQTAVLGNFDVDLVVYSDSKLIQLSKNPPVSYMYVHAIDVNPNTVLEDGYERPIHQLRSHMGMEWRIQLKRPPSKVSVNMKYKSAGLEIDADILVSPNWDSKEELYEFLTTAKKMGATSTQMFRWGFFFIELCSNTVTVYQTTGSQ